MIWGVHGTVLLHRTAGIESATSQSPAGKDEKFSAIDATPQKFSSIYKDRPFDFPVATTALNRPTVAKPLLGKFFSHAHNMPNTLPVQPSVFYAKSQLPQLAGFAHYLFRICGNILQYLGRHQRHGTTQPFCATNDIPRRYVP